MGSTCIQWFKSVGRCRQNLLMGSEKLSFKGRRESEMWKSQHHHGKWSSLAPFSCSVVLGNEPHLSLPGHVHLSNVTFPDCASSLPLCLKWWRVRSFISIIHKQILSLNRRFSFFFNRQFSIWSIKHRGLVDLILFTNLMMRTKLIFSSCGAS